MTTPPITWQDDIARGRAFEAEVRSAWRGAGIWPSGEEQLVRTGSRKGYIDLWDDAAGLLVVCELKSVDWTRRRDAMAVMRTVQRHRNQLFGYLVAEGMPDDVELVLIYDTVPEDTDLRERVAAYLEKWSINVLWWGTDSQGHWLIPPKEPVPPEKPAFPRVEGANLGANQPAARGRTQIVKRVTVDREVPGPAPTSAPFRWMLGVAALGP